MRKILLWARSGSEKSGTTQLFHSSPFTSKSYTLYLHLNKNDLGLVLHEDS